MKKTVLIADKNGQMGNRLFLFAHFISNAIENDYTLYFPGFNEFSMYFECASENRYGKHKIRSRVSRVDFINNLFLIFIRGFVAIVFRTKPVSKWLRIIRLYHTNDLRTDAYDFYNIEKEKDYLGNKRYLILQGWNFRSPQCVIRQQNVVRQLFHLRPQYRNNVADFITGSRKDCDVMIGVHIRRGDYKTYAKGIYYYNDDVYRKFMLQIKNLFPDKKVKFIVCSNENITINEIEGAAITSPRGHFIEDLYTLAACDYIIGPPSTFSQWASYYGNKPLRILWDSEKPILSREEFSIAFL